MRHDRLTGRLEVIRGRGQFAASAPHIPRPREDFGWDRKRPVKWTIPWQRNGKAAPFHLKYASKMSDRPLQGPEVMDNELFKLKRSPAFDHEALTYIKISAPDGFTLEVE
jgi:hypothetical protein